jgi:hypothetical protein
MSWQHHSQKGGEVAGAIRSRGRRSVDGGERPRYVTSLASATEHAGTLYVFATISRI